MSMHVAVWLLHLTFLLILTAAIYFCKRTRSWESPASKTRLKSTEIARAGSEKTTETIVGPREHGSRAQEYGNCLKISKILCLFDAAPHHHHHLPRLFVAISRELVQTVINSWWPFSLSWCL